MKLKLRRKPQEPDAEQAAAAPVDEPAYRRGFAALASELLGRYAVVVALFVLALAFSILLPDTFPTAGNLRTMVTSQAILLLLALAVTLPLRAGDFDLSIASMMAFSAALSGVLTVKLGLPTPVAIFCSLLAGIAVGSINATLIVVVGIDAFITTLGSMTVLGGLTFAITDSRIIAGLPDALTTFSRLEFLSLPLSTYYGWAVVLLLWYLYEYTPVGRYLLFVGGNRDASRLAGLRVGRIRFGAFVGSSVIAAFAGVVLVGNLGAVDPSIGPQYLLQPYAAAFLGTTTIQLGRFNVVGTMVALYLLVVGITGLVLMGAASWVSDVFNGAALIAAVTFARVASRRRSI